MTTLKSLSLRGMLSEPLILAVVCVVLLLPFVNKAAHIDDPCYIWAAQQIVSTPWDYYGFSLNWYGREMPMYELNQNPPLLSYYLAIFGALFGWREWVLHLALVPVALGAALGTWKLAARFSPAPLPAAILVVLCPAFLVSATTLMVDVPMLCLYVWTIEFWCRGLEGKKNSYFAVAGVCAGLCVLTKYFGLTLVPLLAVYTLGKDARNSKYLLWLALPGLAVLAYAAWNYHLYGRTLIFDAFTYSPDASAKSEGRYASRLLTTLAFTGACAAPMLFLAPFLWTRKQLAAWGATFLCITLLLAWLNGSTSFLPESSRTFPWWYVVQVGLWSCVGVQILALTMADLLRRRDNDALFLFLWIIGVFVFVWLLNWTVNARTILPMLPAVAFIALRRIQDRGGEVLQNRGPAFRLSLLASAALALWIAAGDYAHAATDRQAAHDIAERNTSGTLWFSGHWGFQYYMEAQGAKPLEMSGADASAGDAIVRPHNNINIISVNEGPTIRVVKFSYGPFPAMSTMHSEAGSAFYSSIFGMLPFVIGPGPPLDYTLYLSDAGSV